jgi:hypothetical protein
MNEEIKFKNGVELKGKWRSEKINIPLHIYKGRNKNKTMAKKRKHILDPAEGGRAVMSIPGYASLLGSFSNGKIGRREFERRKKELLQQYYENKK